MTLTSPTGDYTYNLVMADCDYNDKVQGGMGIHTSYVIMFHVVRKVTQLTLRYTCFPILPHTHYSAHLNHIKLACGCVIVLTVWPA